MDQQALLDSIEATLSKDLEVKNDGIVVRIPYGLTEENTLLVAEWLIEKFPGKVWCLPNACLQQVTPENLVVANIYYINKLILEVP